MPVEIMTAVLRSRRMPSCPSCWSRMNCGGSSSHGCPNMSHVAKVDTRVYRSGVPDGHPVRAQDRHSLGGLSPRNGLLRHDAVESPGAWGPRHRAGHRRTQHRTRKRTEGVRWVVEQSLALLHQLRRLKMRYDKRDDIHQALVTLGKIVICWRRLGALMGCF